MIFDLIVFDLYFLTSYRIVFLVRTLFIDHRMFCVRGVRDVQGRRSGPHRPHVPAHRQLRQALGPRRPNRRHLARLLHGDRSTDNVHRGIW